MQKFLIHFVFDESGPTAVEYAVMLALIVGMCIATIASMGGSFAAYWSDSASSLSTVLEK